MPSQNLDQQSKPAQHVSGADAVPPKIAQAVEAFQRDLADLLKTHHREWVAYHGNQRVGFAKTQAELYDTCLQQGLKRDEFVVLCVLREPFPGYDLTPLADE